MPCVKMMDDRKMYESVTILSDEINTWNILLNGRMEIKEQEITMLEKQLSDAETLLQNVCQERFQLLDEKENLTEDNKHFVEMFTEVKKMLESKFR